MARFSKKRRGSTGRRKSKKASFAKRLKTYRVSRGGIRL